MQQFHWIRPYYLLALIPLALLLALLVLRRAKGDTWRQVCDEHLLSHLLIQRQQSQQLITLLLLAIGWITGVLALAGPSWMKQQQAVFRTQQATVIALDLTSSLYAADIQPNRLTRAKYKIQDILKRQKEGQTGLVVFSSEAFVVSPLTDDAETLSSLIPMLDPDIMPIQGNNITVGLKEAALLIQQNGSKQGKIILMSANKPNEQDLEVAKQLAAQGIHTSVLAIGTETGAPIPTQQGFEQNNKGTTLLSKVDTQALRSLASQGGGDYSNFTDSDEDISQLLKSNPLSVSAQSSAAQKTLNLWKDQGYWLVLALLPLAALAFRRGWFENIVQ